MSRIRLNLKQLPVTEKIAKAKKIVTALTGNATFPSPTPSLAAVNAAVNAYDAAFADSLAARQEVKTRNSDLEAKGVVLDQLMLQLAGHVESVAGADDKLIHSAGMDTRAAASPSAVVDAPLGVSATAADHDGEIDLSWARVVRAKSYLIEKSPDPPTPNSWAHAGVSTKSSKTMSGLTSNTRYWFRVASVGPLGQSGWSDPVTRVAP